MVLCTLKDTGQISDLDLTHVCFCHSTGTASFSTTIGVFSGRFRATRVMAAALRELKVLKQDFRGVGRGHS